MSFVTTGGVSKWSEITIDADKDMLVKGLSNLKELAAGMVIGDILARGPTTIVRIPAGVANNFLTTPGPGGLPYWGPGGLYLNRYIPATISLSTSRRKNPAYDHQTNKAMPISTVLVDTVGDLPGSLLKLLTPSITLPSSQTLNPAPDHTQIETPAIIRQLTAESNIASAQAEDTPAFVDETAAAQSGPQIYENYTTGEDNGLVITDVNWEAQTFTPAANHYIRWARIQIYGPLQGTVTVSIKATAAGLPTGADLCSATFTPVLNTVSGGLYTFVFATPVLLTAGTVYAICVRRAASTTDTLVWRCDASAPAYAGGQRCYSVNSGANWAADAAKDFIFEEWGTPQAPDMTLFPAAIALNDAYYFGMPQPFPILIVDVQTVGAGTYTIAWEYSQGAGAWNACVGLVDGTNGFQTQWTQEVSHTPQGDWAVDTVNGIANMYWLRIRCTNAGVGYTQPLGSFARARLVY